MQRTGQPAHTANVRMARQHGRPHWMKGNGQYKQFVANRVAKIQLHKEIQWRHVPTDENPADLASSGGPVQSQVLWWTGPEWLQDPQKWPHNLVTQSSPATEQEARVIREVLGMVRTTTEHDDLDQLLERTNLRRALQVSAWLKRFLYNCKNKIKNLSPLLTEEIEEVRDWWIRRIQRRDNTAPHYPQVSLKPNAQGLTVCHGRIQGQHTIYLANDAAFTKKLIQQVHCDSPRGSRSNDGSSTGTILGA